MKMFRLDATYAHGSIKKTFAFFNWNQDFHPHMHHNECYIFFCSFLFCTVSVWPNFPFTFSLAIVPVYSTNDFPRTAVLQCVSISLAKTHTHTRTLACKHHHTVLQQQVLQWSTGGGERSWTPDSINLVLQWGDSDQTCSVRRGHI